MTSRISAPYAQPPKFNNSPRFSPVVAGAVERPALFLAANVRGQALNAKQP